MNCQKTMITMFLVAALLMPMIHATPSGGTIPPAFTYRSGEWYDSWGITRTNADGVHGYLPKLFSESNGQNRELAYQIGESLADSYTDRNTLAEKILKYVQTWVEYGYDVDNVIMNKIPQEEWAWNADELAHSIDESRGKVAVGDCEDMAFFAATLYEAAGFETAIVDAYDHVAVLIYLPDYPNANQYWDLSNDSHEGGWIWVEATGSTNPLGWTPPDLSDGDWIAYTHNGDTYYPQEPTATSTDWTDTDTWNYIFSNWDTIILILMFLFVVFTRGRR
jgi:hypothetical protein